MADPGFDPFQGLPFFGDLAKMVSGQGPISWDAARQMALTVATEGVSEPNVDPLDRISFEGLARVAELHVNAVGGLELNGARIVPVQRSQWAASSLEAYRPLFEHLATSLSSVPPAVDEQPETAMLSGLLRMFQPIMLGMSAGSMVGHLARRSFGQYHLPIPRPPGSDILVLPANITSFAEDWSLPIDDLRLWVCLHELTHHAVIAVPHVRAELESLVTAFVSGFRPDPHALEDRLGSLESEDMSMEGIGKLFADPEVILGAMGSAEQRSIAPRLDAVVAVIAGYVDHVLDSVGRGLIGSYRSLSEAVRRHRVEADAADVFTGRLLGLSLGQTQVDRGQAFVSGVLDRAGVDGLARLWSSSRELPTPAEVDAPGLWLARIDLPS